MKRSTARRQERKARRDQKHAATITTPDGKEWTVHSPMTSPTCWELPPEPKQERGPRAVGHLAWGTANAPD